MLKEIIVMVAFIFLLAGLIGSIAIMKKISSKQIIQTQYLMEYANEID